jgi:diguanylate cyclase (GGDEF)-like protein/PAS domain S-box-containing protein
MATHAVVVRPAAARRLAGVFFLAGSAAAAANAIAAGLSGGDVAPFVIAGACTALLGVCALLAPWDRWNERATLSLLPPGLAVLAFANYESEAPYVAGVFFVVIGMWIGLCHRRYTTVAFAPILALGFALPLYLAPHFGSLGIATVIVTFVSVFAGELLALLRGQLERAQHELLGARERRFGALVQGSSDTAIIFDGEGAITYASPGVQATFGYDPADIERMTVLEFMTNFVDQAPRSDWSTLLDETTVSAARDGVTETRVRHRDGHWIDVESIGQDRTADPDIRGFVYNIRDISVRKQLERRLHQQAYFDELTGLPNRVQCLARVARRLDAREPVSVLFLGLDGFKAINDSAGHAVGDELLREVATRLQNAIGKDAVLSRFGGDEFAIVVPTDDAKQAFSMAEELASSLMQPFRIGPRTISIAASFGVATDAGMGLTAENLVRAADTAMYVAKASATVQIARYEPAMREGLIARLKTETELRDAVDRREFVLHYQPIIDLKTGIPTGFEALIRWRHPRTGLLPPASFIDVAESSGLIVPIGRWVIEQACHDAKEWQRAGHTSLTVAINVSARQFQDPELIRDIRAALDHTELEPRLLKIEVTESVLVDDKQSALDRLEELSAIGVQLALDDFGTGYSSLSYLQALPFDILKVDKSFVDHITSRPRDLALIRTINQLGHDLNLKTLAEGIETAEQDDAVRMLGIDFGQGFLYARPFPLEALDGYLARFSWLRSPTSCPAVQIEPSGADLRVRGGR